MRIMVWVGRNGKFGNLRQLTGNMEESDGS
jgi:hypothetical protein